MNETPYCFIFICVITSGTKHYLNLIDGPRSKHHSLLPSIPPNFFFWSINPTKHLIDPQITRRLLSTDTSANHAPAPSTGIYRFRWQQQKPSPEGNIRWAVVCLMHTRVTYSLSAPPSTISFPASLQPIFITSCNTPKIIIGSSWHHMHHQIISRPSQEMHRESLMLILDHGRE